VQLLLVQAGGLVGADDGNRAEALLQSNSRDPAKIFDFRAVSVLEEAVSLGALPQFSLSSAAPLDLQCIPPCTAEVRSAITCTCISLVHMHGYACSERSHTLHFRVLLCRCGELLQQLVSSA